MPNSIIADLPADIRDRAARVKLAAFDVDGVLTDGRLLFDAGGVELKMFHVHDGLGLKLLRDHGVEVALVTARESKIVEIRSRELGLRYVFQGQRDKLSCIEHLCRALTIKLDQVAYAGDDLPDIAPMQRVGFAVAVANAHPWVRERAHWRTQASGGEGAVREICDLILAAQGKADKVLAHHLAP